jgi:5-methylcytosine-specific restriction endonuclease McrA
MDATTVDHIIPVAKGGSDDPENLVAACKRCNFSKQDKMPDEFVLSKAGLFSSTDSTAHLSRGFLSPPNESIKHE